MSAQAALREVKPEDIKAMLALMRQLETRYFEESSFEELFFQLLSDPAMELQAAVLNGEIVGFLSLRYHLALNDGLAAALEEIAVDGRQREQGVGSALLEWAVKRAGEKGCRMKEVVCAHRRRRAHEFYRKHGFGDTGRRFQRSL
ncbi:MAG: GNAT family N-acetyltransferase [Anaerolineae bacterium]